MLFESLIQPGAKTLFSSGFRTKKRTQIVAVDLGARTTKAVHVGRRGQGYELLQYAMVDAPATEAGLTAEGLAEHLKAVVQALGAKTKQVVLVAGVGQALLRHAELPLVPVSDMRLMLKFNTKNYLQQDLPEHIFDCYILPPREGTGSMEPGRSNLKTRVLVGAAKKQLLEVYQSAAKAAGLVLEQVALSLVGPANVFELAVPETFTKEVVALVDIGFAHSTITILKNGELVLSRVVGIGGDKLTAGLAEALGISYAEAEGIKVGMPEEVQSTMMPLLIPLGRELRASIDFFEHQEDKAVSEVYVSGGSARSPFLIQTLQSELMAPCKEWNPVSPLTLSLPAERRAEVEQAAPQLAVAIGSAIAAF